MLRKFIFVAFVLVFSLVSTFAVFATNDELEILPVAFEMGDVNMDSTVNVKDATSIQKHLADIIILNNSQLKLADVNYDKNINIKDATFIQKLVAGLVEPMTPPSETATIATDVAPTTDVVTTSTVTTDATEVPTESSESVTDFTEATPVESSATEIATDPVESSSSAITSEPATRDPDKPIELPFVPAP